MGKKGHPHMQQSKQSQASADGNSGCGSILSWLFLSVIMLYMGVHVYFLWQPAGSPNVFNARVMDFKVAGVQIFPAIQAYPVKNIAGRVDIIEGRSIQPPLLKQRLALAIERNYPITFREEEINAWLAKRLEIKQAGVLAGFAEVRGVWVHFQKDEIELIIERELLGENVHITSLFMGFERTRTGYRISRHSCHIGQLRLPGGFGHLLMPAFQNMVNELADELQPYYDHKIFDVRVEEGKITIDPRRVEHRL